LVKRGLVLWPEKEGDAILDDMIDRLEETDEDAVERELVDGDGDGEDVFGPTIRIETPGSGLHTGDCVGHHGDVGRSSSNGLTPQVPAEKQI